jgi:hypothetical protein
MNAPKKIITVTGPVREALLQSITEIGFAVMALDEGEECLSLVNTLQSQCWDSADAAITTAINHLSIAQRLNHQNQQNV